MDDKFIVIKTKDVVVDCSSLEALARSFNNVLENNRLGAEEAFNHIYEESLCNYGLVIFTFKVIIERLEAVYGVKLDAEQLRKQAMVEFNESWPEIRKKIVDFKDAARQINDIFKKRDDQPGLGT